MNICAVILKVPLRFTGLSAMAVGYRIRYAKDNASLDTWSIGGTEASGVENFYIVVFDFR